MVSLQDPLPTVKITLPPRLRPLAGARKEVAARGATVGEALNALLARYPDLRPRVREKNGNLRPELMFFLNFEDIRAQQGEATPVKEGDVLAIVPIVEGG